MESHLLQMRGLKLCFIIIFAYINQSHLLQMRGLKQEGGALKPSGLGSHLLQMRGLKHLIRAHFRKNEVASFTDAWIETKPESIL